ncbi:hypothetical protein D9M68_929910 [compost metagenome]
MAIPHEEWLADIRQFVGRSRRTIAKFFGTSLLKIKRSVMEFQLSQLNQCLMFPVRLIT